MPGAYQVSVTYYNECSYVSEPYTVVQETFTISFHVFDLEGAEITNAKITFDAVAYESGHYLIENIPEGTYQYLVEKDGYHPVDEHITVSEDTSVEVIMTPVDLSTNTIQPSDIRIFPSPAKGSITVDWQNHQGAITNLQLFSSEGMLLLNSSIKDKSSLRIDTSSYKTGIYFIVIHSTEDLPLVKSVHVVSE